MIFSTTVDEGPPAENSGGVEGKLGGLMSNWLSGTLIIGVSG